MARAPFPIADRVSLADVGEYMKQKSDGHEGLALGEVQAALVAGCSVEFIWMKEGREVWREYPEPDFFRRPILGWHWVVPRRLQVQLPLEERKGDTLLTFLRLSEAVRHGLRPASEAPQAEWQPQQPTNEREPNSGDAQSQLQSPNSPAEVAKLSGKQWVSKTYARRPNALLAMGITGASKALAEESKTAPDCAKPLTARYSEKLLRDLRVFPKAHRGSPKQRPK
jgi:hypothetical protein